VIDEMVASNQAGATDEVGDHSDWVEIHNPGPGTVELEGMYLTDVLADTTKWRFPSYDLPPGGRVLVWCDEEPAEGPLHATFRLSAGGGEIGLFDTTDHGNQPLHAFTYGPQNTDVAFGTAPSGPDAPEYLVPPTPLAGPAASVPYSSVCINELRAASNVGAADAIELYNRGLAPVDLTGWHLSDDAGATTKYTFPATSLPAGAYLTVTETTLGFALAADGSEVIVLTRPGGAIGMDWFDYGPQLPDVSQGRYPNGTANWHSFGSPGPGVPNDCSQGTTPPDPVGSLRFDARDVLRWDPTDGAAAYDVVRATFVAPGSLDLGAASCRANNTDATTAWDATTPAPGETIAYVVRGVDFACGFGTWEPVESGGTLGRDAALGDTCP
jgi:hypothetical protein